MRQHKYNGLMVTVMSMEEVVGLWESLTSPSSNRELNPYWQKLSFWQCQEARCLHGAFYNAKS